MKAIDEGKLDDAAFNLSILECKSYTVPTEDVRITAFNLSILECKLRYIAGCLRSLSAFNLSILECKFIFPP